MTLDGLIKRGGVWTYRKVVPPKLRTLVGAREIWRSLGTTDERVAIARWGKVKAEVDRTLAEAASGILSPAVAGYKAIERWRTDVNRSEDGLDWHLQDLAEEGKATPAILALLSRQEQTNADNPPLSVVFSRYYAERRLPAKTRLEWDLVLGRLQKIMGGDSAVRGVTQAHVRGLKDTLLSMPSHRGGRTLAPATVQKNLAGLRAVLGWARSNGYITANPAEGMIVATSKNHDDGRKPYSIEDLRRIFDSVNDTERGKSATNHWLPWLALYTGARLEELGQLRYADVRYEDAVPYLAIEPGDGKRVKTKSSRRRVPIHPRLIEMGFINYAIAMHRYNHERLFPDLKATSYGSLTAAWSKWWGRHARKVCGISDPRKTFHSFRHGWKDAARGVMPEEHHDAITGHSNGSVGRSYGHGVPLKVLAESMAKISFKL